MVNKAPVPVGEIVLDLHLDGPSRIYAELYAGKHLMQLEPGTKLYAGQPGLEWPKLDKPAKVGAGRFNPGVSARLVVEAAQRQYEYDVTPEKEAARIERLDGLRNAVLDKAHLRSVVTDALIGMIAAVTDLVPPKDGPIPDFIQAAIDRAVDRIADAHSQGGDSHE